MCFQLFQAILQKHTSIKLCLNKKKAVAARLMTGLSPLSKSMGEMIHFLVFELIHVSSQPIDFRMPKSIQI